MKFIDLFSGIGGFRLGMEMAGHECVGHCEIDRFADRSYRAMHNVKEGEWYADDIRTVRVCDIPEADVWCFGFPCQDISVAGKQKGFKGNRSSLFFAVTGLLRQKDEESRPKYLLIENVKNLLSVNRGYDFARLLIELDEIGYDAEWDVLNSKNFGVPQNRERVFIIGHFRGRCGRKVFPLGETAAENTCRQIVGGSQGMRIYDPTGVSVTLSRNGGGLGANTGLYAMDPRFIDLNPAGETTENARCIQARYQKGVTNRRGEVSGVAIYQRPHGYNKGGIHKNAPTLTGNAYQENNVLLQNCRIRKLTPKECFRLQGFPDEYFERASKVNSDSQLYKQAGNSVTVNVIYEIARRMKNGI